ncbi:unnamed protein product, partial [Symbiodinium sp. CCMP2592]
MAEAAPPTGMGNRQLREWIQEWGSAWDFLGLAPGSAMSEVLRPTEGTSQHGSALPTKAPPPRLTTRCGGSVEAVENLMGFIGMAAMGAVALDTLQERATHWICPDCQDETTIKANQCSGCGCWRPRHGSLINNGPAPDDLLVHPRASTDEQMEEEGVTALCRYSRTAPSQCRSPSTSPRKALEKVRVWAHCPRDLCPLLQPPRKAMPHRHRRLVAFSLWSTRPKGQLRRRAGAHRGKPSYGDCGTERRGPVVLTVRELDILVMCRRALCGLQSWGRVGVIFIRRVAQDILHWAHRRGHMSRIHLANRDNPCFMDLQEAHPEPQGDLPPLSPATGDHRPLFTFQDFLRNPSLGQHYGGNEGPPRPGRAALPCIYPAPLRLLPLAETYAEADQAQNVMGRWAMQILGNGPAVPPDEGVPPADGSKGASAPSSTPSGKGSGNAGKRATHWYCKRCSYGVPITRTICTMCNRDREQCVVSDDEEPEDDVVLNKEELEEVARLERECADLEQRMRGLNAGQQRALLENLANSSSAVMGGLLADTIRRTAQLRGQKGKGGSSNVKVRASNDTARNDPKYLADLEAGVSTAVAFQRHRSRLRAVQHQVAQGNVA